MDDNLSNFISDEDLAAFLDGNVTSEEAERLLSVLAADREAAQIVALSPFVDQALADEKCRVIPMRALAAANPDNLCSFECELFILRKCGIDADHWSLLETAKANNWLREAGTPLHHVGRLLGLRGLHVERRYDASVPGIEAALAEGKFVLAIVDKNKLQGRSDTGKRELHALLISGVTSEGSCQVKFIEPVSGKEYAVDSSVFLDAWQPSGHYMVIASSEPGGYNPTPIDVSDIDLHSDLEELTEALAENAHDTWARARMDEGWTYGPVRNDALKQHPDLVPYALLPDSEKKYDRILAMNTLRLVRRLGFSISTSARFNES